MSAAEPDSAERYWSTEEQRWIYDDDLHVAARALREAAADPRWDRDEHRHIREWLLARAERIEGGADE